MSLIDDVADALARDVIKASRDLNDEGLIAEIAKLLGDTSSTTQEAFQTAVRMRLAEERARRHLADRLSRAPAQG